MVIDTHVLLWWFQDASELSDRAREFLAACGRGEQRCRVSPASLWELEWKRHCGRLPLVVPVREWLPRLRKLPFLDLLATDATIWLSVADLDWDHRDPADRIIAATALRQRVPVLTKDAAFFTADCPVEAVW